MNDRFVLIFAVALMALIALDLIANSGAAVMFLLRRGFELVEYLAFWR